MRSKKERVDCASFKTLCGTIASVEDRGYVVDLGIPNVKAFLTQSDAERGRTAQGAFLGIRRSCVTIFLFFGPIADFGAFSCA